MYQKRKIPPKRLALSRNVDRLLQAKGWRQADLARSSGLDRRLISSTMNCHSYPGRENLAKIAAGLGVDLRVLLDRSAPKQTPVSPVWMRDDPDAPGNKIIEVTSCSVSEAVAHKIIEYVFLGVEPDACRQ
jgi:transcriptional regulator with XRE-family HTH domain